MRLTKGCRQVDRLRVSCRHLLRVDLVLPFHFDNFLLLLLFSFNLTENKRNIRFSLLQHQTKKIYRTLTTDFYLWAASRHSQVTLEHLASLLLLLFCVFLVCPSLGGSGHCWLSLGDRSFLALLHYHHPPRPPPDHLLLLDSFQLPWPQPAFSSSLSSASFSE